MQGGEGPRRVTPPPCWSDSLRNFFYPKSVAVIGVSETPGNLGKLVIKNLATFGFGGRWHAVGQKPGMILDRSIYRSVLEIPDEVDMAAILTPAKFVPGTVRACAEKGIKRLTISTAGFSEYREEGAALEKEILEVCEKNDIRFIGPNCLAVINMENGLCLPFSPQDRELWKKGPVGVISQSGTMAIHYSKHLGYGKVGVGKVASIGNKLNVDEVDLLEYFIEDPSTKLVVLYLESFSRPGKFLELAASCKKPIILHKSNTSSMSRSIARSHTKAVTGNDAVTEFSLKEAGVIRVRDISEMMNCVKAALLPPLTGKRLAVVSGGGGTAIIGADDAYRNGFDLPTLPGSFLEWLRSKGRAGIISLTNPIDVGDIYDSEVYSQVIERLLCLTEIDGVFFDFSYAMEWAKEFPRADCFVYFNELYRTSEKPVVLRASTDHPAALAEFDAAISVPYFDSMSGAFSALRKVKEAREGIPLPPSVFTWPEDSETIGKIICKAKSNGKTFLDYEGYEILQSLGIPVAPYSYIPRERATSAVELNFG
ncbi:MAG: CoA-binding protein, partial [Deltaproteobacteria bacterium]|nr:CoA-binding protein [Deltaproteobacteria bacterium]